MRLIPFIFMSMLAAAAIAGTTVAEIDALDAITVPSTTPTRSHIYVFTDTGCPFCSRLHRDKAALLQRGIAIHYLFYPREGPGSESFRQAVAIWCSDDRIAALDRAMHGFELPGANCKNPIQQHYELARELELLGTPAIVTEFGGLMYGMPTAKQMRAIAAYGSGANAKNVK